MGSQKKQAVHRVNGRDFGGASGSGSKTYGGEHVISRQHHRRVNAAPPGHPRPLMSAWALNHTLFAKVEGHVEFRAKANGRHFRISCFPMTEARGRG